MNDYNGHTLSSCSTPMRKRGVLYIERLMGNQTRKFIVYSPHLKGFFTHYNGDKTVPCFEDHTQCPGGHNLKTLRQYFLLHAYSMAKKKQVFAYLTPGAAEMLLSQKPDGHTFRGRYLTLTRTEADNGRLVADLGETYFTKDTLPEEADPYPSIFNWMKIPLPEQGKHLALFGGDDSAESLI